MAATTDNQSYEPKSVHRKQLSTEGQTMTVSSGGFLHIEDGGTVDCRGALNLTTGASQRIGGTINYTSDATVSLAGDMRHSVVVHSSNSTMISNSGFKVLTSTENIKILLAPPQTGSHVKLAWQTTNPIVDEAIYQVIVSKAGGSTNARIAGTTGRMITFSTNAGTKAFKFLELFGTTHINGRRMWVIGSMGPFTSEIIGYTISSATD